MGRSRGGLSTKIHALVDALGNPVGFSLTPGQAGDLGQAEPLLESPDQGVGVIGLVGEHGLRLGALQQRGITPVIPSKANRVTPRQTDFALYRERNLIERFFNKLKHFRAIATRYDKTARNFLAAIHLVATIFLLN